MTATYPPHPLVSTPPTHSPLALFALNLSSQGHTKALLGVAFSRDGKTMATAGGDHTAKIWDRATGTCKKTLSVSNLLGLEQGAGSNGSGFAVCVVGQEGAGRRATAEVIDGVHVVISKEEQQLVIGAGW